MWQRIPFQGKKWEEEDKEIITEKGEKVRSKSEKIIADKSYWMGIPYRYEAPIVLNGNIKLYPDFTILRMPEREEVYLEHFGKMDDEDYVRSMMNRLELYEKNGIFLGEQLFFTHETGRAPLNTRVMDRKFRKWFIEEEK